MPDRRYQLTLDHAAEELKAGKVLLFPTDTIWGLGASILHDQATNKIFEIKRRPKEKSFIMLVSSYEEIGQYVDDLPHPDDISYLLNQPTTIIYDNCIGLPLHLQNADKTGAFRIVSNGFCHELIKLCERPLLSTSPNFSGTATPVNFDEIDVEIREACDFVLPRWIAQYQTMSNKASRIVKLEKNGDITIIRE